MRLLFAHAFIGLVIVAIGIAVNEPFQPQSIHDRPGTKKGLSDTKPAYHIEISGTKLTDSSGRYHIDPNFREEFSNFRSIDIPVDEKAFVEDVHGVRDMHELEIDKQWRIESLVIDGDTIAFQTTSYNGESYVFAGRFGLTRCSIGSVRFLGQLTRLQDNMVVATVNADFHQVCGC